MSRLLANVLPVLITGWLSFASTSTSDAERFDASLTDTIAFLKTAIGSCPEFVWRDRGSQYNHIVHYATETYRFTGNNSTFEIFLENEQPSFDESRGKWFNTLSGTTLSRARFADLNPKIDIDSSGRMIVRCRKPGCLYITERLKIYPSFKFERQASSEGYLPGCDAALKQRVAKALQRAIMLNGGKPPTVGS